MRRIGSGNNSLVPRDFGSFFWPNSFISNFFDDSFWFSGGMKADIRETDDEYLIEVEVPGMKKEDLEIKIRDNVLTVSATLNEDKEEKKEGRYIRRERRSGFLSRSFTLDNVKVDAINAEMDGGVLTITCPKLEQRLITDRRIDIH
ncbi:MAG: Hsp20/alpha crystallin family protein [Oscillospiraceae bacterium]|jgi:HSP20 family protein